MELKIHKIEFFPLNTCVHIHTNLGEIIMTPSSLYLPDGESELKELEADITQAVNLLKREVLDIRWLCLKCGSLLTNEAAEEHGCTM